MSLAAVRFLPEALAKDADALGRFEREADELKLAPRPS
jgi:hypothetical protein